MKDVNLPRLRWKKGHITKLIKRNNRPAFVSTTNILCINRPLHYIIPLELEDARQLKTWNFLTMLTMNPRSEVMKTNPKRDAAVNTEIL